MCCALSSSLIQASSMLCSRVGLSAVCLVMSFFIIPAPGTTTRNTDAQRTKRILPREDHYCVGLFSFNKRKNYKLATQRQGDKSENSRSVLLLGLC